MRLLRVDHLDLFGLHGINNEEVLHHTLRKGGALEAALRLKEEGRVRHVGFSTHGPTPIILEAIRSGGFDYVNLHWYYIFQDNWPAIEEAHQRDMGVFIISPSDKGGMLYNPPEKLKRLTSPLSPVVFNDLFCLSRPEVHTLSVGAGLPENFEEHLSALNYYEQRGDLLPPIVERLQEEHRRTLGEDWIGSWKEGLPSWQDTPGGINIPVILHLWNLAKAYDLIEYGKMRYNLMGNGGHWFPGSRPASLNTLDFARCLQRSAHAGRIPAILKEADDLFAGERVKRLGKEEG
jgi:predicted aldo/keto reductase-like oxidoreductase